MVVEQEISSFVEWLLPMGQDTWHQGALFQFMVTALVIALAALVLGFLVLLVRYGPAKAGDLAYKTVMRGVGDLLRVSPQRVLALAWLSMKESFGRQAIVALAIYGLILGFASWFLKTTHMDPARSS